MGIQQGSRWKWGLEGEDVQLELGRSGERKVGKGCEVGK